VNEHVAQPRRLHPATLISRSVRVVPQMLGGGAAYAAVIAREGWSRVLLFAAAAGLLGLVGTLLYWWRFRYTVGASEIVIESGVLKRQRRVIPYDRVQDIAIEQPLLARLFGTARVRVETGGSAADEGDLDMISLGDAQALRDRMRHDGTTAPQAAVEEPVLFSMSLGRLLHSGLFNFSIVFLAAIFAVLQYLDEFGVIDIEAWFVSGGADAAAGYVNLQVTLLLIALLLVLGVVAGVARTAARDFGFRLTRMERGLRRRRGLFTLSEVVIPIGRTQVALIDSGPISRLFGWHRLSFQTLGADQREGGVQVAAPFARMEELLPILGEAGFPVPPPRPDFERLPRRALLRRCGPFIALAAVAALAAALLEPRLAWLAAAMALLALFAALKWRRHAYALDEQALFVSSGLLKRRLWSIPYGRTQTIHLATGPLQRRLGLATLLVDTAGASVLGQPEIVDVDGGEGERLADRLLALFHEARAARRLSPLQLAPGLPGTCHDTP
jgi:putative membrane protein